MLEEKIYTILLVSASEKFNTSMVSLSMGTSYQITDIASGASAARRKLLEQHYDFVIINSPVQEETGLRLVSELSENSGTVCLFLASADLYEQTSAKASSLGAFSMQKPVSSAGMRMALDWMASACEKLHRMEKKSQTLEEKMAEIKLVNRAKWMLIENLKMTEDEAHRYIEKQAMDRCLSKREIAENIIKSYS